MKDLWELLSYRKKKYQIKSISKEISSAENKCQEEIKEPLFKCRYVITVVGFGLMFFVCAYRMNMSVAIVAMVNSSAIFDHTESDSCPNLLMNTSDEEIKKRSKWEGEMNWSPKVQGYILGSNFIGYAIAQIPAGILAERFGCKWILFWASFITAVGTFLMPVVASEDATPIIILQIVRGVLQGFVQPSLAVLSSNWFPKTERGLLYGITQSGVALGGCLGGLITGYLCHSGGGYPSSFYAFGFAGLLLSAAIVFFVYENPSVHPRVSKAECQFILKDQENPLSQRRPSTPWGKIFTSLPVYAFSLATFGFFWTTGQFTVVHSTFLGTILHFSIEENGLYSCVPFLLLLLMSHVAGFLSSHMMKKKYASIDTIRKLMTFISTVGLSACLLGMYFAGCNRYTSILFAILFMGFAGFGVAGCGVVSIDMSPTFSGTIQAVGVTFGTISTFVLPVVVGYFTDEMQTIEQWNKVFFTSIGVGMSTGIAFVIFGSAEVQPWNYVTEEKSEKKENHMTKF